MFDVRRRGPRIPLLLAALTILGACTDRVEPTGRPNVPRASGSTTRLECRADVHAKQVACARPRIGANADAVILGGQGTYVQLLSDSVFYNGESGNFDAYLSLQNLTGMVLGTSGEGTDGVDVFVTAGPVGEGGTVTLSADGMGTFTDAFQQYMHYDEVLDAFGGASKSKLWNFVVPSNVPFFTFTVLVYAPVAASDIPLRWTVERGFAHFSNLFVYGLDSRNVFAFGEQGVGIESGYTYTVARFDGADWHTINTNFPFEPAAAWGSSPSNLWVVGEYGNVAHYDGASWQTEGLPREAFLTGVWGSGPNDVYAVGGCNILHFDGETWEVLDVPSGNTYGGITGTAWNDIYAVGTTSETSESVVLHFDGESWTQVELPSESFVQLATVYAHGSEVWAGGEGGTIHLKDGVWTTTVGADVAQISGTDPSNLWAVGLTTGGGGESEGTVHFASTLRWDAYHQCWKTVTMPTSRIFQSVWTGGPSDVWVVGSSGTLLSPSEITITDGVPWHWNGAAWTAIGSHESRDASLDHGPQSLNAVFGADPSEVWAVGTSGQILRDSAGSSWRQVGPVESAYQWRAVWGSTAKDIWVVGDSGQIRHWDGTSLKAITAPVGATLATLRTVFGFGPNDVYAGGDLYGSPVIIHYDGESWTRYSLDTYLGQVNSIWGRSSTDIWAAGVSGILHFDGEGWNGGPQAYYSPGVELLAIHGSADGQLAIAVGTNGLIVRESDDAWVTMSSGTDVTLTSLYTDGPSGDMFAVGARGTMLRYAGNCWKPAATGVSPDILGLWMSTPGNMYIVGGDGFIAHGSR